MNMAMSKVTGIFSVLLMVFLMGVHMDADARRMGGGGSFGRQSNQVTQQRQAQPPAQQRNAATTAGGRSPMMGMLGGLAAVLGLSWLASQLGLGEEFGNILMLLLLGMVALAVIGFIMRSRNRSATQGAYRGGNTASPFSGMAGGNGNEANRASSFYRQGGEASAAPASGSMIGSAIGGGAGSALSGSQTWGIPQDFDIAGFIGAAKRNFVSLQKAWDDKDLISLRSLMTDEMLEEIRQQLTERDAANAGKPNKTEVVTLDARLLGIEELPDAYMASVEFSGMIHEDASLGAQPFREVWNMTKPRNGASGWVVAGIQALQ